MEKLSGWFPQKHIASKFFKSPNNRYSVVLYMWEEMLPEV